MLLCLTAALLLVPAVRAVAQDVPTLYGTMVSSDSWWDSREYGIYSFKAQSVAGLTKVYGDSQFNADAGAAYHKGKYYVMKANDYGSGVESVSLYVYDAAEWEQEDEDELSVLYMATDFAENPLTHQLYGACSDGKGGQELAIVDFANRTRQTVGALSAQLMTLAIDATGTMFGIATNGNLYRVDATDASLTYVGNTGVRPDVMQSMTFDWATGKLYWAASYEDDEEGPVSRLYEVNTENATVTRVAYFNNAEQLVGLYCLNQPQHWEGPDAPVAPADLTVTYADQQVTLTWTASTAGIHGGEVDPAAVTYSIVRQPGNITVAEGLTATTFSETLSPMTLAAYSYEVTAWNGSLQGGTAKSSAIVAGTAVEMPYLQDFSDANSFKLMTTIDGDGDGYTWELSAQNGYAVLPGAPFDSTDDWLVTPPIRLQADRLYRLQYQVSAAWAANYPYSTAAYIGQDTDEESLTEEIVKRTHIATDESQQLDAYFQVEGDGNYNIGIQGYGYDIQNVVLDNIRVVAGPLLTAPAAVGDLTAQAGEKGQPTATITFKAPELTVGGSTLEAISKIEVRRGETLVKAIEAPAPGSQLTVTDYAPAQNSANTYSVVAFNADGEGLSADVTTYVGEDTPLAPANVRLSDEGEKAVLTWEAPTEGVNGGYVNAANLRYGIVNQAGQVIANELTECRYEYPLQGAGSQQYLFFGVGAYNKVGQSTVVPCNPIVTGTPYTLPFDEHVTGGTMAYFWGNEQYGSEDWTSSFVPSGSGDDVDGDGGHFTFSSGAEGSGCRLYSGKISLKDAANPILEFYYDYRQEAYDEGGQTAPLRVGVIRNGKDTTVVSEIQPIKFYEIDLEHPYTHVILPLKDVAADAEYVQGVFDVQHFGTTQCNLDAITVRDQQDYDLAVTLTAPAAAKPGDQVEAVAQVKNIGTQTAQAYTVALYAGERLLAQQEGSALEADQTAAFTFAVAVGTTDEKLTLTAVVDYEADQVVANNRSGEAVVNVALPDYPTPADLAAVSSNGSVELTWSEPDYEDYVLATVDGAEDYEPWAKSGFGQWTTVDADGKNLKTLEVDWTAIEFPGSGEPMAWMVCNPEEGNIPTMNWWGENNGFQPVGGKQYFISLGNTDGDSDDWLISPELTGESQTVSFYQHGYYGYEQFEVLYSTTDKETASFISLGVQSTAADWTQVSFELPEGAKYFAIRHLPGDWADNYLLVDDIVYKSAEGKGALSLTGYNVYRDGQLIGTATECSYADGEAPAGNHRYQVTAVYNLGESAAATTEIAIATALAGARTVQLRPAGYYSLDGKHLSAPVRGLNIIRMTDGSVRKAVIK